MFLLALGTRKGQGGLLGLTRVSLAPVRICCKFWNCPGFAGAGGLAGLQPRHGLCAGLGYPCLGQHNQSPSCPVLPPCWASMLALDCCRGSPTENSVRLVLGFLLALAGLVLGVP